LSIHPTLQRALQEGVFFITRRIATGQLVTPVRCNLRISRGVTHLLNVGESPSLPCVADAGFHQFADVSIEDLIRIPDATAITCLDFIRDALAAPDTKLFIHCTAGQNRSPTVLWLYLLACGMNADEARQLIVNHCPDAVPGHPSLVDAQLISVVKAYGSANFADSCDTSIYEPAFDLSGSGFRPGSP
jgi:hypothetical protein